MWDVALAIAAAGSGAAWAKLAAWRAGERGAGFALRALLGGAAAFGLALVAYEGAAAAGLEVRWDRIGQGGVAGFFLAGAIGLVEEGAKLAGILLVVDRGIRTRAVLAASVGVAAGFASFETLVVLGG
jgi:RsiW-degrading membrane proteinase PrsW (M82 family)